MKFVAIFIFCSALSVYGQEARLFDEFTTIPCGDFMGRMDSLLSEWKRNTSRQIFVVYYGHRFRKSFRYKKGKPDALVLSFPHREDGLSWAKSVPKYLFARVGQFEPDQASRYSGLRDKIKLLDGGFREDIGVEIWLTSEGAEPSKPTPTVSERNISFRSDRPYRVPDQINCYSGY